MTQGGAKLLEENEVTMEGNSKHTRAVLMANGAMVEGGRSCSVMLMPTS
jgi:hypothetical protein